MTICPSQTWENIFHLNILALQNEKKIMHLFCLLPKASELPLVVFLFPWTEQFGFFFVFVSSSVVNFFIEYPAAVFSHPFKQIQFITYA